MNTKTIYEDLIDINRALKAINSDLEKMGDAVEKYIESLPKIPDIEPEFKSLDNEFYEPIEPYGIYQDGTPEYMGQPPVFSSRDLYLPEIRYSKNLDRYVCSYNRYQYDPQIIYWNWIPDPSSTKLKEVEIKDINLYELNTFIDREINRYKYYENEEILKDVIRNYIILDYTMSLNHEHDDYTIFESNLGTATDNLSYYFHDAMVYGWIDHNIDDKDYNSDLAIYELNDFNKNRQVYLNEEGFKAAKRHDVIKRKIKDIPRSKVFNNYYAALSKN